MKKIVPVLFLLLSVKAFSEGMPEKQVEVKFRDFSWGTTMQDFIAKEGIPYKTENQDEFQSIKYEKIEVSGYETTMIAVFSLSRLVSGSYSIKCKNMRALNTIFDDLALKLSVVYGTPVSSGNTGKTKTVQWLYTDGYITLLANEREKKVVLLYMSPGLFHRD
ncbi:hypothetical protein K7I13_00770 [Brucepastera parasyntrophica]|uniref:hypothetical protein n=1 Tax=Brucepastera parasyntrophica TaxID=2880008 RepID=UPI00210ED001|nr:hypothetical protein [Brucepastera parasyntrophica]ULQ59913.1 hypothetical protein K7I13_00770 [Brucepastera parasyntrophica]